MKIEKEKGEREAKREEGKKIWISNIFYPNTLKCPYFYADGTLRVERESEGVRVRESEKKRESKRDRWSERERKSK